jgi:mannose-6-phosphate isomerase
MLYPLKFRPILKPTIWGGERLISKDEEKTDGNTKIGESWEISAVQDHISVVAEGPLAGNSLEELIEVYMGDLVGDKIYETFGLEFPLLIKYIDANSDLSIQVHPDDATAKERHHAYGKNEMWYIVDNKPESRIILGFKRNTDKQEFLSMLQDGNLNEILNYEQVVKGDCFFVPAGTIHSICKGCFIAEIQQTSDITYRVYDYNRLDANGAPRELHTELAADIINYQRQDGLRLDTRVHKNHHNEIISNPYFTVRKLLIDTEIDRDYFSFDSFVIYMCIDGEFSLIYDTDKTVTVHQGDTILLPAIFKQVSLRPKKLSTILEILA